MNTKNVFSTMLVLFAVLLFLGCGAKHMYPGPELSKDELAVLTFGQKGDHAFISEVDGTWIWFPITRGKTVHLLPGDHTIKIKYGDGNIQSISDITLNYHFKAGHEYTVQSITFGMSWNATIADITMYK